MFDSIRAQVFASPLRTGTVLALSTACISGVSLFVNKFAVSTVADPILFSGFKNAIVGVCLAGIIVLLGKHREVRSLSRRQVGQLSLIGLIGGAIPFALFFTGLSMMPAATGAMIHKTLFVWVALMAVVFLRERFSLVQWLAVAALFAANLVLGGFQGFEGSLGELLVLAATLFWAAENIIAKKALAELSILTVAGARMVLGSGILFVFLAATGRIEGIGSLTLESFLWTFLTAVFLLGYVTTWYAALKRAPASLVAALLVPSTLITTLLSALFVTHTVTTAQVIAGYLFLAGAGVLVFTTLRAARSIEQANLSAEAV